MKKLSLLVLLAALPLLSGCGTIIANQVVQSRHPAIKAQRLAGGAGIGVDLLNLGAIDGWGDAAIQLGGAAADALTVWGGYQLYNKAQSKDDDSRPAIPSVVTGNNSPVQINIGAGSPGQANPNTTISQ